METITRLQNGDTFEMVKTSDNIYRYVNHEKKLLTTGFPAAEKLDEYKLLIRFDSKTIEIMTNRYKLNYSQTT